MWGPASHPQHLNKHTNKQESMIGLCGVLYLKWGLRQPVLASLCSWGGSLTPGHPSSASHCWGCRCAPAAFSGDEIKFRASRMQDKGSANRDASSALGCCSEEEFYGEFGYWLSSVQEWWTGRGTIAWTAVRTLLQNPGRRKRSLEEGTLRQYEERYRLLNHTRQMAPKQEKLPVYQVGDMN